MEKIGSLLWILLAIGAFVFRMLKKVRETTAQESRERPARPNGTAPPLPTATFQEMLKQMQARNTAPSRDETAPVAPSPISAAPAAPRTLGGRLMPRETARPARSQERTLPRRPSLEAPATARPRNTPAPPARRSATQLRASLKEPMPDDWQTARTARQAPVGEMVRQMLREPESLRAAFVLGEIFRRRD